MPQVGKKSIPEGIKAYVFLGMYLEEGTSGEHIGDCPKCGAEDKFSVNGETGKFRCFGCTDGNAEDFIKIYYRECLDRMYGGSGLGDEELKGLSQDRGISTPTLKRWGVVKSILRDEYLLPGYSLEGKLTQLYRYTKPSEESKSVLLSCPGLGIGFTKKWGVTLLGLNLYDDDKPEVYICEGPWDAMALDQSFRTYRETKGEIKVTTGKVRLIDKANILAVPGCSTFKEGWNEALRNKVVKVLFDNDYPREDKSGKEIEGPAIQGVKRLSSIVGEAAKEIHYLKWGEDGYTKEFPDKYDVRDLLKENTSKGLKQILSRITKVPSSWKESRKKVGSILHAKECTDWKTLVNAWNNVNFEWTWGLDVTLSVMLACCTSTEIREDPLWFKIMGPPSSGKSTLAEGISVNKDYVLAKSTITGFHSGFKTDPDGSQDNSLIAKLDKKTLVTKDGDTLLNSESKEKILSQARDLFDGTSRSHYNNAVMRDYEGLSISWLLCGTPSLKQLDESELGERFLDCYIMSGWDEGFEDRALEQSIMSVDRPRGDKDIKEAKRLTGGYVGYLRRIAKKRFDEFNLSPFDRSLIGSMAKFISYMRARPSTRQDVISERENPFRLSKQLAKLAKCLTIVLNKDRVDEEVMKRVRKVVMDTSDGTTLRLLRMLEKDRSDGMDAQRMKIVMGWKDLKYLEFLKEIKGLEMFKKRHNGKISGTRWRISERLSNIHKSIINEIQS